MSFIKNLLDDPGAEDRVKEQLNFLLAAAKAKLAGYKQELKDMFLTPESVEKVEIVGKRAIAYYEQYQANVKEGVDDQIMGVINSFFAGSDGVKDGFKELIKIGLQTILGSAQVGEQEMQQFFIVPEHNAIIRVDVKCWRYEFSSDGVIGHCKNAFCYVFCKSVVDHTKITLDEMTYLISSAVGDDISKVQAYMDNLRKVWAAIEGKSPTDVQNEYQKTVTSQ